MSTGVSLPNVGRDPKFECPRPHVVLVHENRGVPDGLFIIHLPFGPTAFFELLYVVTRHDIKDKKAMGTMPQVYPHLILDNFTTKVSSS
ncbi:unnamed protein product [Prunus armeniaca]